MEDACSREPKTTRHWWKLLQMILVNLPCLVLLSTIWCFSLCCTGPSCTILHFIVPSCTFLYHIVPHCVWFRYCDTVYVFEHGALWSHCRLDSDSCWAALTISARCAPSEWQHDLFEDKVPIVFECFCQGKKRECHWINQIRGTREHSILLCS